MTRAAHPPRRATRWTPAASRPALSAGVRIAGWSAGLALLALYAATTARAVTFWDAAEFVAAIHTLGIPHPPGTPLYILLGRAWTVTLGALGVPPTFAANLLSAACTALAGAIAARWAARSTGSVPAAVAGVLVAGAMSTAWANATEAEVYAPALLAMWATLAAADRAGRALAARVPAADPPAAGATAPASGVAWERATALVVFGLALAVPLHLSVLVVAPAAALLVGTAARPDAAGGAASAPGRDAARRALLVLAAAACVAGVGSARWWLATAGGVALLALGLAPPRLAGWRVPTALVVGLTATLVLLVRARHDPVLDQGDPATWTRLVEVVARRQYAVQPPWPRLAPWWLQLGNLFQWADFQVALGLAPGPEPTVPRTGLTLAYAALGVVGARWHRARDRRGWRTLLVLLVAGSVGVAAYLNLRAGPSFGAPVLPPGALHEARERDYFFVLAWWAWGMWAGMGGVALGQAAAERVGASSRARWGGVAGGLLAAAVPIAVNWRVADRTAMPAAQTAEAWATAILTSAPPRAILLLEGDNDSYPVWHAQAVRGLRRDVVPVTLPLLGAPWYRAELARRADLLDRSEVGPWPGEEAVVAAIARRARATGRPLAASAAMPLAQRAPFGPWIVAGVLVVRDEALRGAHGRAAPSTGGASPYGATPHLAAPAARLPDALARRLGAHAVDTAATRRMLDALDRAYPALVGADARAHDAIVAWALARVTCARVLVDATVGRAPDRVPDRAPALARGAPTWDGAPDPSLEATCKVR